MRPILVASLAILLGACGYLPAVPVQTYDGPGRPVEEVAVIGQGFQGAFLGGLDGKTAASFVTQQRRQKGYHVLPGVHQVSVMTQPVVTLGPIQSEMSYQYNWVNYDLKAGHTYLPRVDHSAGGGPRLYLEDMGTGYNQECLDIPLLSGGPGPGC